MIEKENKSFYIVVNCQVFCYISDKIKDLLKPGTVSAATRLVLVNAIYLKADWKNRFNRANTKEMPFKVSQVKKTLIYVP